MTGQPHSCVLDMFSIDFGSDCCILDMFSIDFGSDSNVLITLPD